MFLFCLLCSVLQEELEVLEAIYTSELSVDTDEWYSKP